MTSQKLRIAVAVGHTLKGADFGAQKYLVESICTREIGAQLVAYLAAAGNEVFLCRIDEAASVDDSLAYRTERANQLGVDLYIEIHLNSGGGEGVETYAYKSGGKAEEYAKAVQVQLIKLGYPNRGVKFANFYVLKYTDAPAILVECGFVDSENDAKRYNPQAIAQQICAGVTGSVPSNVPAAPPVKAPTSTTPTTSSGVKNANAKVINDWFYTRKSDGTIEPGRRVDIGDGIRVIDVSLSKGLCLVEYPIANGTRQAYIKNVPENLQYFKKIHVSGKHEVYDRFSGADIGSVCDEDVILLEDLGNKLNVLYCTKEGNWDKSGVISK